MQRKGRIFIVRTVLGGLHVDQATAAQKVK